MDIGPGELIIILLIVIILFGSGRLMKLGGEMGSAIRSFREGLQVDEAPTADEKSPAKEAGDEEGEKHD